MAGSGQGTADHMAQAKTDARTKMAARRNGLDAGERERWSQEASFHAIRLVREHAARSVMVYVPFRSELGLQRLVEWCWEQQVQVIVPRCIAADRSMTLHALQGWDQLRPGAYGIPEPDPDKLPALPRGQWPEMVFVPGLAFDLQGGRMGYGGGYYDRLAEAAGRRIGQAGQAGPMLWIGAAFEAQLVPHVPMERHDLRLDGVVTERGLYMIKR